MKSLSLRPVVLAASFVLLLAVAPSGAAGAGTPDQQQPDGGGGGMLMGGVVWYAQTFTAQASGELDQVDVRLLRIGSPPGSLTVQIRTTVGGSPTATVLASASVPPPILAPGAEGWIPVPLSAPAPSVAGAQYAIVLGAPDSPSAFSCFDGSGCLGWNHQGNDPYPAGTRHNSHDNGVTWGFLSPTHDFAFKTYVVPGVADPTAPDLVLNSTAPDPTNTSPIPVTVQFTEWVTGFAASDVVAGNATVDNFVAVDGDTYTFDLTPSGEGLVTANVAAGAAQDAAANPSTAAAELSRSHDSTPPAMSCSADPGGLHSNNHKLVPISAAVAVDDGGPDPAGFMLVSVHSSQPDSGMAAGDEPDDIQGWAIGTADTAGLMRTERYGSDRVYTLTYRGSDAAGNTAVCQTTVTVDK